MGRFAEYIDNPDYTKAPVITECMKLRNIHNLEPRNRSTENEPIAWKSLRFVVDAILILQYSPFVDRR